MKIQYPGKVKIIPTKLERMKIIKKYEKKIQRESISLQKSCYGKLYLI